MTNATNTKGCKPRNNNITVTTTATLLTQIARKHLRIETLATRKRDSLDFPEVPVWGIKSALQAAYEAGLNAARAARPAAPATDADAMVDILRDVRQM